MALVRARQGGDMITTKIAGALAALALLAAPAVAAAHDSGDGHGRHHQHKRHAKQKQSHPRDVTGTATASVTSFTNGELTLALPGGKTFSALVTDRTILICKTAAPATASASRHGDDGDDDDQGDDDGNGRCDATALVAGA